MYEPRSSITPTRKRYTVAFMCCDPVCPVHYRNTNDLKWAKHLFDVNADGGKGGFSEWKLVLWEHGQNPRVEVMTTRDPFYGNGEYEFVYYMDYPESTVLDKVSYMDQLDYCIIGGRQL